MSYRVFFVALLAVILGLGGVAGAQETVLTYMTWSGTEPGVRESLLERIRGFEARNPGVRVEVLIESGSGVMTERLIAMHSGGVAPDVFQMSRNLLFDVWQAGMIQPVTRWALADPDFHDILGSDQLLIDGEIWWVNSSPSGNMLVFNGELYDAAGIARPDALYQAGGWTTDDFVESARRITRDTTGDGQPNIFGTEDFSHQQNILAMLRVFGTTMLHAETGDPQVNTPEGIATIDWIADLTRRYNVAGGNRNQGSQAIWRGSPGGHLAGWGGTLYNFDWNIAPFPKHEVGHKVNGGYEMHAVSSQSSKPELAYKLIQYLTSAELELQQIAQGGAIMPIRASVWQDPLVQERWAGFNLEVLFKSLSTAYYMVPDTDGVPGFRETFLLLRDEVRKVINGDQSAEQAAHVFDDTVRRTLR